MKAILVIDAENIDIENTQATYIELQCNNLTIQMALLNHWLKHMPQKKYDGKEWTKHYDVAGDYLKAQGYNQCLDEILGDKE